MKNFKKLLTAAGFLTAVLVASNARAEDATSGGGLFVEPMITYQDLKENVSYPNTFLSDSSGSADGFGVGARIGGAVYDAVFLAADLRYSLPKYKDSNFNADATEYNYGLVVGAQMPVVGLRVWGTWVAGGELNPKESNNVDLKFKEAQGYRVGAGFHIAMVSLNLEYQDLKYNKTEIEKAGPLTNVSAFADDISLKESGLIASVSFPFEF